MKITMWKRLIAVTIASILLVTTCIGSGAIAIAEDGQPSGITESGEAGKSGEETKPAEGGETGKSGEETKPAEGGETGKSGEETKPAEGGETGKSDDTTKPAEGGETGKSDDGKKAGDSGETGKSDDGKKVGDTGENGKTDGEDESPEEEAPEDESSFAVNIPSKWTAAITGWVSATEDLTVYFKTSATNLADWGSYEDADAVLWSDSAKVPDSEKNGSYIKFWAVKVDTVFEESAAVCYYLDKTAPDKFTVVKVKEESGTDYVLCGETPVSDSASGIDAVYYSIGQKYNSLRALKANASVGELTVSEGNTLFSVPYTDAMLYEDVYVYLTDAVGNIRVATYKDPDPVVSLTVTIPSGWTNSLAGWVRFSDNATVYYKTSDSSPRDWGNYSDSDAHKWGANVTIDETDDDWDYIHFWAVVDGRAWKEEDGTYRYEKTVPDSFGLVREGEGKGPYYIKNESRITDKYSGVGELYYSVANMYSSADAVRRNATKIAEKADGSIHDFSLECTDEMYDNTVYIYAIDLAGNMRTEARYFEAPTYFILDVPQEWDSNRCNDASDWVDASDDLIIYFSVHSRVDSNFGSYTDAGMKTWNGGENLDERLEAYIKFWAIKGDTVFQETEPMRFRFDKTKPTEFSIKKTENGLDPYLLENDGIISDPNGQNNRSGAGNIYYSVGEEYTKAPDIRTKATETERLGTGNQYGFSIECTPEMDGKTVYVYVVDRAGNVRTASCEVGDFVDKTAPNLEITGINSDIWYNWETKKESWEAGTSIGAVIYYKTALTEPDDWGKHTDDGVRVWDGTGYYNPVEVGEGYIHFWAAYASAYKNVAEKTIPYKYDDIKPAQYNAELEIVPGTPENNPSMVIKVTGLTDTTSGIVTDNITYRFNRNGEDLLVGTVKPEDITTADDGTLGFTLDFSSESFDEVQCTISVLDRAGNEQLSFVSDISYDPDRPLMFDGQGEMGIVRCSSDAKEKLNAAEIVRPYSYGSAEANNEWTSVYIHGDEYLRLTIQEDHLQIITVAIDSGKNVTFVSPKLFSWILPEFPRWIDGGETEDGAGKYYLKISDIVKDNKLPKGQACSIVIKVYDRGNSESNNQYLIYVSPEDGSRTAYTLFYDPKDDKDTVLSISPEEVIFGQDAAEKSIEVSMKDDFGLKEFTVWVNGAKVKTFDLYQGRQTTEAEECGDTDGTNDGTSAEATEKVSFRLPYEEYVYNLPIGGEDYPFMKDGKPVDGQYYITVELVDLAGNTSTTESLITIDTTEPVLDSCEYEFLESPLNNRAYGVFGREGYTIHIKAYDPLFDEGFGGSGIKSVVMQWGEETFEGTFNEETGMYDFEPLPVGYEGILTVTITDEMDNEAVYGLVCAGDVIDEMDSDDEKNFDDDKEKDFEGGNDSDEDSDDTDDSDDEDEDTIGKDDTDKDGKDSDKPFGKDDNEDKDTPEEPVIRRAWLMFEKDSEGLMLMLEDIAPISGIVLPEEFVVPEEETDTLKIFKQAISGGKTVWWYPADLEFKVYAQDETSGLFAVRIVQNEKLRAEETAFDEVSFDEAGMLEEVTYFYKLTGEGRYRLFAYAIDNALNSDRISSLPEQTALVNIDKTKPQITEMQFDKESDQGDTVEKTTYGFFFRKDTEAKVYVEDAGVSSGIDFVELYLSSVNDEQESFVVKAEDFLIDEETKRVYALFTIKKGFKGQVTARVTDNVGHTSGIISADGNIIEDQEIHNTSSGIEIKENASTGQRDVRNIPLYRDSIPLTVTVTDSFSGIGSVDWSIANDGESGRIEIGLDGKWRNVSGKAQIIEDTIERDQNLVTKLQFVIVVDSNSNGNLVSVTMKDRAGNTSHREATYSIDTTAPEITASFGEGKARNGYFYNVGQTITVTVKERNFNPNEVVLRVNGSNQTIRWNEQGASLTTDETEHVGTFTLTEDAQYDFSISYSDMAGNSGTSFYQSRFVIDKTNPVISNNFEELGAVDDENIYFNISQKDDAKAVIKVIEENFYHDDMHIVVYKQPAGSKHTDAGAKWEPYWYSASWEGQGAEHTLTIPFTEDGVYKVVMAPVDRAGNVGDFSKAGGGQYPKNTAIFEVDYTAPVVSLRNGNSVKNDSYEFCELYDYDRRNDDAPTVAFADINIAYIEYKGQRYTPVYSNGREIGVITPEEFSGRTEKTVVDEQMPTMIYTLKDFTRDGVYSVKLLAYDKAGNVSVLNDNTYVRMVDPTVKVLAYIENSDSKNSTGWYSFEDANGPISKRPASFSDLSIVVFSRLAEKTRICLVDKATNEVTDTQITGDARALFDDTMYDVGAYRYVLPGAYFAEHFTADADTSIYLRVENNGEALDLGEMNIDNTMPNCEIPEHFHDWGWVSGSGEQTLVFRNISEVLEIDKTVAYVDGETIPLSLNPDDVFVYNEQERSLSLRLQPGSHKVGLLLTDRAGNTKSITEVHHLAIGNYRIWIGAVSAVGLILLLATTIVITKKVKRRRLR